MRFNFHGIDLLCCIYTTGMLTDLVLNFLCCSIFFFRIFSGEDFENIFSGAATIVVDQIDDLSQNAYPSACVGNFVTAFLSTVNQ